MGPVSTAIECGTTEPLFFLLFRDLDASSDDVAAAAADCDGATAAEGPAPSVGGGSANPCGG